MDNRYFVSALAAAVLLTASCSTAPRPADPAATPTAAAAPTTAPPVAAQPTPQAPSSTPPGTPAAAVAPQGSTASAVPAAAPKPVTLPAGTNIRIRTTTAISTKTSQSGDPFEASLEAPLVVDGKVVAEKGATVHGVVAESDPGGRVKGVARIAVRLTRLETVNGPVEITTASVQKTARSTKKADAVKVGIGSGIGAAIGAIAGGGRGAAIGAGAGAGAGAGTVLATRGEPAVFPAESVLTFRLSNPAKLR